LLIGRVHELKSKEGHLCWAGQVQQSTLTSGVSAFRHRQLRMHAELSPRLISVKVTDVLDTGYFCPGLEISIIWYNITISQCAIQYWPVNIWEKYRVNDDDLVLHLPTLNRVQELSKSQLLILSLKMASTKHSESPRPS
jgi:hypothetical protein